MTSKCARRASLTVCLVLGLVPPLVAAGPPAQGPPFPPCPANSAWVSHPSQPDFNNDPTTICGFYQYSWQSFLDLVSPAPAANGALKFETLPEVTGPVGLAATANTNALLAAAARFRDPRQHNRVRVFKVRGSEATDIHQAGSQGILVDQNNNLTYYEQFESPVAQRFMSACSLAVAKCKTVPAAQPLRFPAGAIELKVSWRVIPPGMPGANTYYIVRQVHGLPDNKGGTITADLGLTGLHLVFATAHHPELIWSTFEHIDNAPNGPCVPGKTTKPPPGFKTWAFNNAASTDCSKINDWPWPPPKPIPPPPYPITQAFRNWELGSDPQNQGPENSWDLLALNLGVNGILPPSSVWRNYLLSGGIWTSHGALPATSPLSTNSNEVGALFIANSTMETFTQYPNPAPATFTGEVNCFSCHNTPASGKPPYNVSHAVGTDKTSSCPYSTQLPAACAATQVPAPAH
jgi:hypothetical protein